MRTVEPLYGMTFVQDDGLPKFTTDALLLADFAPPVRGAMADFCCGTGILSVLLCAKNPGALSAIELSADAAALARENLARNGFAERARVRAGDLRDFSCLPPPNSLSLAVCNPPYFAPSAGMVSPDASRAAARAELSLTLSDLFLAARRSLAYHGRLCLCFRPERSEELLRGLADAGLAPKRLRFVHPRPGAPANLLLCEARKGSAPGLTVDPPLLLSEADGSPSAEYRRIYQL